MAIATARTQDLLATDGSFKRRVLRLVLAEPRAVRWIVGGALVETVFTLAGPWLSSNAIDVALPNQAPHMLAALVVLVVLATLHTAWIGWLHEKVSVALMGHTEASCLEFIVGRLVHAPLSSLQRRDFGSTTETVAAVSGTTAALVRTVATVTAQSVSVVVTLSLVAVWFPKLALATGASALLMAALATCYALREAQLAEATLEASSRQRQTLHVLLRAVAVLRVSGATPRFLGSWGRQLAEQTRAGLAQHEARVSQGVVFEAAPLLVSLGAMAWLVNEALNRNITLGEMMLATMLIGSVMSNSVALVGTYVAFHAMRPLFDRIDRLLVECEAPRAPAAGRASYAPDQAIVVDHVWFRYHEEQRWILADHSCHFPARQISELRAASGAGKTTLLRLIAGLLEPQEGSIRVLGRTPQHVRSSVCYLPQQSLLLETSIAQNLRVLSGRPLAEALEVAHHTGLSRLLERLPMGVETVVSLAGGNLSAGQRQLILLTAAFASARPVVLLDEATSQLDREAEQCIDWQHLTHDKTVITVRHD